MRVIIVGAGGHGQVVCDALLAGGRSSSPQVPIGFVDDQRMLEGTPLLGVPVLGTIAELDSHPHDAVVLAIGDNRRRFDLFTSLRRLGEQFCAVIHPRAVIAADVTVGHGTVILGGAVVNTGARIGSNAILNTGCTVDHHSIISDHAHVAPGVHLAGHVKIGEGALVGIGATVLPGRDVARWSTVGAGSLVLENVPEMSTVFGVPAKSAIDRRK